MGRIDFAPGVRVKHAEITAKIIRADGTVEDRGVIASTRPSILSRIGAKLWPRRN